MFSLERSHDLLSSWEGRFALPVWQRHGAALWPFLEINGETPALFSN
jgi:hypothetical protein